MIPSGLNADIYVYDSPVGKLLLTGHNTHITGCAFIDGDSTLPQRCEIKNSALALCVKELDAYFNGTLQTFTVPLKPEGTAFRQQVWSELQRIPFGKTISYRQLAAQIGQPKAVRAVGGANHHNPIVIIIPCHRVIGADGRLTGYGGGLDKKAFLLEHEQRNAINRA